MEMLDFSEVPVLAEEFKKTPEQIAQVEQQQQEREQMSGGSFGWGDEVVTETKPKYVLLEEGVAQFEVKEFKRGRFGGSATMSPGYQAEFKFEVMDIAGNVGDIWVNLPLNEKLLWKIVNFFKSTRLIGEDATSTVLPWSEVKPGLCGMCLIKHSTWTRNDGSERTTAQIHNFLHGAEAVSANNQLKKSYEALRQRKAKQQAEQELGNIPDLTPVTLEAGLEVAKLALADIL